MRRIHFPGYLYFLSAVGTAIGGTYIFRDSLGGGSARYEGKEKLEGKVIIITGANGGIGREMVRELAKRKAKVVMACRDLVKCEEHRMKIVLETQNKYVYCRMCDLASQKSIRDFVEKFKKEHDRLDVLINNAGVMMCKQGVTKDGIETQLGVNHMGHFLLTNLLLDVLKKSAPARIVNLTDPEYRKGTINTADLNSTESYEATAAFRQSKLAVMLFTRELAKRLEGTGVTVNSVYPGIVDTDINRHMPFVGSKLARFFVKPLLWVMTKTPFQGAQPVLTVALDPELKNVNGAFFSEFKQADPGFIVENDKVAKWLWLTSAKWTKLQNNT